MGVAWENRERALTTLAEYKKLPPTAQGFIVYMEADRPGSELKGQTCPYAEGTLERQAWEQGQARAVQYAQDGEE